MLRSGEKGLVRVEVKGNPRPSVMWSRSGEEVGTGNDDFNVLEDGSLMIISMHEVFK